jgi:uncharacterized delta-60 repeat protein
MGLQPDGKIVVAATQDRNINNRRFGAFLVARYNSDGTLDPTFNGTGTRLIDFDTPQITVDARANAMVLRPNGKILVAGRVDGSNTLGTGQDFGLVQLNPDGSLDTSFGPNHSGKVETDFSRGNDGANAIVLQADGRAIVAGDASTSGRTHFGVVRYTVDGSIDAVSTYDSTGEAFCYAVALRPNGQVLLAGTVSPGGSDFDFALLHLHADWTLERETFLNLGSGSDVATAITLQSDGKVILAGGTTLGSGVSGLSLARVQLDGSADFLIRSLSQSSPSALNPFGPALAVALDGDGRILTAGTQQFPNDTDLTIARWCPGRYPVRGVAWPIPGRIEAEDYDHGGPGVAYWDTTLNVNEATGIYQSNYRPGSGVDLELGIEGSNDVHVAYIHAGEWLQYTVDVANPDSYRLAARVSSLGPGGTFHIEVDGVDKTGPMTIPDTRGWLAFQTIQGPWLSLSGGQHLLRVVFDSNGSSGFVGNLNFLEFLSRPVLKIRRAGNQVVLSWPTSASDFVLESGGDLTQTFLWVVVPDAPVVVGNEYTVTLPATYAQQFFRLAARVQ